MKDAFRKPHKRMPTYRWRYILMLCLMSGAMGILLWRMVDLTITDQQFLKSQGDARSVRTIPVTAYRGMITDRHGEPLAVSSPVKSVWVQPQLIDLEAEQLAELAKLLALPLKEIKENINKAKRRQFLYLKRGLTPMLAEKINALNIKGLYLQQEFRRYYPTAEVGAHLIGFTDIDDKGQEGIELAYDDWLRGEPGSKRIIKDRLGNVIADLGMLKAMRPGKNIVLSIDQRIQYIAYRELERAVKVHQAVAGTAVVLDAKTGEVLAMVNQPSFNPNSKIKAAKDGRYRNRAVTDLFEPGSVLKAFTVTSALESGHFDVDTMINTHPGWMILNGNRIRDYRNLGEVSVKEAIIRSSNVAMTKMTLVDEENPQLYDVLKRVGFGGVTESQFPGERSGVLVRHPTWKRFDWATLSFGYGVAITPLQLARSFTVFANSGKLLPVTLLKQNQAHKAKPAITPTVSTAMRDILQSVVEEPIGTGKQARVPGYYVAGKTGTTRVLGENGYDENRHNSSFVGLAPANRPRLIIAVVIYEPSAGDYYGALVAAPVFSRIMAGALRVLEVMPDRI